MSVEVATQSPTFVSQYGPLIAALIALFGALATLIVTGRREERHRRTAAEDDYRREQRQAVAAIAVAAHDFRRTATALAELDRLLPEGYDAATTRKAETEAASAELLNSLTVARLLVHDHELQVRLDALHDAWLASASQLSTVINESYGERPESMLKSVERLTHAWGAFDNAAAHLHEAALARLAPVVIANS